MKKFFKGLSKDTFLLTFSSLFSDVSTEMLYPILPVFLTDVLKAPTSAVGVVEGIAVAAQYVVQGISGWIADRFKSRKLLAIGGASTAALAKFVIGFSTNWIHVATGRTIERLSSGVRSSPRDALVADSATEDSRGKAFGVEGFGDNLGAFVGPLIAVLFLYSFHQQLRAIFFWALIPGLLAVLMIALVKEKKHKEIPAEKQENPLAHHTFPKAYWKYLFVTAVFGIGNSSNAFLILRTKQLGVPLEATIIIYAFFNLIAALSSYPAGFLSDKLGRRNVLLCAFLIFIVTYAGFAFSTNILLIGFLFLLYGVFGGTFRAVGKAFATDFVPSAHRASAVGWYATTIGFSTLVASFTAGQLWTLVNPSATFIYGAIFAAFGTIALLFLFPKSHPS